MALLSPSASSDTLSCSLLSLLSLSFTLTLIYLSSSNPFVSPYHTASFSSPSHTPSFPPLSPPSPVLPFSPLHPPPPLSPFTLHSSSLLSVSSQRSSGTKVLCSLPLTVPTIWTKPCTGGSLQYSSTGAHSHDVCVSVSVLRA